MFEEKTAQGNGGIIFLVKDPGGTWFGCIFLKLRGEALHLSKPVIQPARKSEGIGCKVIETSINEAQSGGRAEIELQAQVELTDKLSDFSAIGFAKSIRLPVTVATGWFW